MSESDFDPRDIDDIGKRLDRIMRFEQIVRDNGKGYSVEFHLTSYAAREMVREWIQHMLGDPDGTHACLQNYNHIMTLIFEAVKEDEEPTGD